MSNPLITVVVPVYNVEDYLDECVESLINQTYSNLEILLVDDGSPDNSPFICDQWAERDSRVRVIHKKNGGLSSARNVGIENARGDYLSFVDSDDFFDSKMYEKLYEGIMRSPNIGLSGIKFYRYEAGETSIYNKIWDTKKDVLVKADDFGILALKKKICHAATNKLYKKELFASLRFREGIVNEDVLFSHDLGRLLIQLSWDLLDLDYYAYYYRIHNGSICRSKVPIDFYYIRNLRTIIDEEKKDSEYKSTAIDIYHHTLYDLYYSLLNENTREGEEMLKIFRQNYKNVIMELRYQDVMYKENVSSIYARLSFYATKYFPRVYRVINSLRQ